MTVVLSGSGVGLGGLGWWAKGLYSGEGVGNEALWKAETTGRFRLERSKGLNATTTER